MPLAGAALGAASGTLSGYLADVGINDKWMKETAAAVQPGTAALFVLVRKVTADKVLDRLKGEGGTVLKTSLDHTKEAALQAALAEVAEFFCNARRILEAVLRQSPSTSPCLSSITRGTKSGAYLFDLCACRAFIPPLA
jgi:hypothetical protein